MPNYNADKAEKDIPPTDVIVMAAFKINDPECRLAILTHGGVIVSDALVDGKR